MIKTIEGGRVKKLIYVECKAFINCFPLGIGNNID
jgi:hypothetical protein